MKFRKLKTLLGIALVLWLGASIGQLATAEVVGNQGIEITIPPAQTLEEIKDATVFIRVYNEEGRPIQIGSGFLTTPMGLVLTNYHVIHQGATFRVWQAGKLAYYPAIVVGIDPLADLALLQLAITNDMKKMMELLQRDPLPWLEIEKDPDKIQVGDEVWAFGHPLGQQFIVTKGIINRVELPGPLSPFVNMIMHDAILNSGSSGGPLVNKENKVVGVNTFIFSPRNGYTGLGAATRGDTVFKSIGMMLASQYNSTGEPVARPALDIRFLELDDWGTNTQVQKMYPAERIPNTYGILVFEVKPDSHAYVQGLREFDTIVAIDGIPTNDITGITRAIGNRGIGEVIRMLIIRKGVFEAIDFTLGKNKFDYISHYDKKRPNKNGPPKGKSTPQEPEEKEETRKTP